MIVQIYELKKELQDSEHKYVVNVFEGKQMIDSWRVKTVYIDENEIDNSLVMYVDAVSARVKTDGIAYIRTYNGD